MGEMLVRKIQKKGARLALQVFLYREDNLFVLTKVVGAYFFLN